MSAGPTKRDFLLRSLRTCGVGLCTALAGCASSAAHTDADGESDDYAVRIAIACPAGQGEEADWFGCSQWVRWLPGNVHIVKASGHPFAFEGMFSVSFTLDDSDSARVQRLVDEGNDVFLAIGKRLISGYWSDPDPEWAQRPGIPLSTPVMNWPELFTRESAHDLAAKLLKANGPRQALSETRTATVPRRGEDDDPFQRVVDAIHCYDDTSRLWPPANGQRYADALAKLVGDWRRDGLSLEEALARLRSGPGREPRFLPWGFVVEVIDERQIQVTYLGPAPSLDRWRCWRAEIQ